MFYSKVFFWVWIQTYHNYCTDTNKRVFSFRWPIVTEVHHNKNGDSFTIIVYDLMVSLEKNFFKD